MTQNDCITMCYKIGPKPIKSTYGTIYSLFENDNNRLILKKYNDTNNYDKICEGVIMKNLSKYNLVAYVYGIIYCNGIYGLLMPYYEYCLSDILANLEQIKSCLYQLLLFLDLLKSHGILHRDLKPNNILIDNLGQIKVIDFGFSCYQHTSTRTNVGTIWYRAPEILLKKRYNYKSDLWSIGCSIAELIIGEPLFNGDKEAIMMEKITQFDKFKKRFIDEISKLENKGQTINDYCPYWPHLKKLKILYEFSPKIFNILINLLEINPKKRKDPFVLLQNECFKDFNLPIISSDKNQLFPFYEDCHQYKIKIPELLIEQIKYKINVKYDYYAINPITLYQLYNNISDYKENIIDDLMNNNYISDQEYLINDFCIQILKRTSYIIDPEIQLDIIVQCIDLYNRVITKLSEKEIPSLTNEILKSLKITNNNYLIEEQYNLSISIDDWYLLFKICYHLIVEIYIDDHLTIQSIHLSDPELQLDKYCNIKQMVIDLINYELKQNRNLYHTAHNYHHFNNYNNIYNILYLIYPLIRKYKYNYIICCLQKCKYGHLKSKILESFVPQIEVISSINDLMSMDLITLRDQLNVYYLSKETIIDSFRRLKIYRKKYRKNVQCQK